MSFKGKKNVYLCPECGRGQITLDVDDGVTPMFMSCLSCDGMAKSCMHQIPQEWIKTYNPAVEWYRPHPDDITDGIRDHVLNGGLVSRVIEYKGKSDE